METRSQTPLLNLERAILLMDRAGVDFLVASTPTNVVYVSGFDRTILFEFGALAFAILPANRTAPTVLILPQFELASLAAQGTWMQEVRTAGSWGVTVPDDARLGPEERRFQDWLVRTQPTHEASPIRGLARALRDLGAEGKRVGFDDVRVASELAATGIAIQASDVRQLFREIRAIKTGEEIRRLRDAAVRNDEALGHALAAISPGVLWQDVIDAFESASLERGSRVRHWVGGAGRRSSAHFLDTDYAVAEGDLVRIDCGGTFRHYSSDTGRTGFVGAPPREIVDRYQALQAGILAGEAAAGPGVRAADLYDHVIDAVRANGLPHFVLPNVGHAIGLEQYDSVRIAPNEEFVLAPGFVFNLEVPYYELGWGGLQLEDTFCVTAHAVERLTALPREILELGSGAVVAGRSES